MHQIAIASTPDQIEACFPVMSQLRPKLAREDFVGRVQQLATGAFVSRTHGRARPRTV
jgi:hypothetical protein